MYPWLHVARTELGWLVIPVIHDPLFVWAISRACPGLRFLPTARGWLVPHEQEHGLWSAIAATHGHGIVCPTCLRDPMPCDAWVNVLSKRFEGAREQKSPSTWVEQNFGVRPDGQTDARIPPRRSAYRQSPPRQTPPRSAPRVSREDRLRAAAKVLGITWPADRDAVKKAFRKAILRAHPDLGGDEQKARKVVEARDLLME